MRTTMDAIREHKAKVLEHYAESQLLGIFVYGSQNYSIATETSDVDTKAILVPTLEELCLGKPVSRELHLDNGEHCEVKDIRELVKMFRKQNINFLEILYTDYCWINPKYNRLWRECFINNREKISHMDMRVALMSICGQAIHTLKQNKTDGKKFSNGLRLYHTLKKYIEGENYDKCIDMIFHEKGLAEKLISYKKNLIPVIEDEVDDLIGKFLWIESIAEQYPKMPDSEASLILDEGILALVTNDNIAFDFYKNK